MINFVERTRASARKKGKEAEAELDAEFDRIAGWLAGHPGRPAPEAGDTSPFAAGYRAFENRCGRCHSYHGTGGGDAGAPDLTGYGGTDWVRVMVMDPAQPSRYGLRNTMPAFRDLEGPTAEVTRLAFAQLRELLQEQNKEEGKDAAKDKKSVEAATRLVNLSAVDRELIIRWLTGDDRVVFGGDPIAAPPRQSPR